jgi:hypothetical protein
VRRRRSRRRTPAPRASDADRDRALTWLQDAACGPGSGFVEIRLPDGASASTDGIEAIRSSIEDHRKNPPPGERPHIVITGTIQRGSLELRGPRPPPFRKR